MSETELRKIARELASANRVFARAGGGEPYGPRRKVAMAAYEAARRKHPEIERLFTEVCAEMAGG
jgi:hypothetical protein